ncbi:hypothetical protein EV681_1218 [Advenella incenata]|uniref:Uncharacterized protein n=1 Tax=Advenella incenata TaxID=267800 RepID=A0A4V2FTU1_9BURK|nr:hypothetical protein EV681_1218 [Advenella incenata]
MKPCSRYSENMARFAAYPYKPQGEDINLLACLRYGMRHVASI